MRTIMIAGAAVAMLMSPAIASETEQPTSRTSGNEMVCKNADGSSVATRIGRRKICMTRNQWRQLTQTDRDNLEDIQLRSLSTPPKT